MCRDYWKCPNCGRDNIFEFLICWSCHELRPDIENLPNLKEIPDWVRKLADLNVCLEALRWGRNYPTLQEAWQSCERGDWMLWLIGKLFVKPTSGERKKLILTACQCARLSLLYVKDGETRPLKSIELVESWISGNNSITKDDLLKDKNYALEVGYYAIASACQVAYNNFNLIDVDPEVASIASLDDDSPEASDAYASAFESATIAYHATLDVSCHKSVLKQCADIVRNYYPEAPKLN